MQNKDRIRKLEIRKNELVRNIHTCGYHKKKIIFLANELSRLYSNDKISYSEYNRRLSIQLDSKKPEEWVSYYDERLRDYNNQLNIINEGIRREENKFNITPLAIIFAMLVILGIGAYYLQPTITGFIIGDNATIEEDISEAIIPIENITLLENITIIEEIIEEEVVIETEKEIEKEILIQGAVEINKPVKWIKRIKLKESADNLTLKLSDKVSNIKVSKVIEEVKEEISEDNIKIIEDNEIKPIALTGYIIKESEISEDEIGLIIEEEISEVEIEYYTEGPKIIEKKISEFNKEVTIYSDIHYENILAYTTIKEAPQGSIRLYRTTSGARESTQIINYTDRNNNGLIDEIKWIVPSLSNETYKVEISILNVQSYPTVGGNWEVRFTTLGIADLIITAVNGTTWSNENNDHDLRLNQIKCGNNSLDYEWINNFAILRDYECDDVGYETSRVLTSGAHHLEFRFGEDSEYAHNEATFLQNNYTFYYNISGRSIGEWTVFNRSFGISSPPTTAQALDGRNDTATECNQGMNLRISDDSRCVSTLRATNQDGWLRFNFTINEAKNGQMSNITSVRIILEGRSSDANTVLFIQYNRTGVDTGVWSQFGATATTTEVTRTATYNTLYDIQQVISNITNQTILLLEGNQHDAADWIGVDFVQVVVNLTNYTVIPEVNYAPNVSNLVINSTSISHLNLTTEDLQVRFNVSDPNTGDMLTYNITWFTNNRTNFTLKNIAINNPGASVQNLTHQNTTKYDNWSAQIVVCDNSNACSAYVNTSALYIKNSNASINTPAFNQTTFNNEQIINVSVKFSDDDGDANSITFEWFNNNALIKRTTNSNLANGTNTTDVLTPVSFTVNDQIIVQAFAFDGNRNSSLKNSTTLTITSSNSAPNDPTSTINSTFATNLSAQDLHVSFTPSDPDAGETLTYDIWAFENGSRLLFNINNLPATQDALQVFAINFENTTKGNNYSAQIRVCDDSVVCSVYVNTSQLVILNTGPQITNVSINPTWSVTVNGNTSAFFSFSVRDDDNYTDIGTNIFANFSRGGETTRHNNTNLDGGCKQSGNFGKYIANYSCTVNIVFYDGAGDWNVSLMLNDKSLNYTMNKTKTFNLGETTSFSLTDSTFTFPGAAPNVYNVTASDAIYMNNTGNDDINASSMNITAVNIHGDTLGATFIPAFNFTVANGSIGRTDSCDISKSGVYRLTNKTIAGTTAFNSTRILGTALTAAVKPYNEQILFLCLLHTPADLTNQVYSTNAEEDWSIIIS